MISFTDSGCGIRDFLCLCRFDKIKRYISTQKMSNKKLNKCVKFAVPVYIFSEKLQTFSR